jgi:hypothetical protein
MIRVIILFVTMNLPKHADDEASFRVAIVDLSTMRKSVILSNDPDMNVAKAGDCFILQPKNGEDRMKIVKRCN